MVIAAENSTVMFDVDAIRKEALALALEGGNMEEIKGHMQIREIESTLPALKITSPNLSLDGKTDSNTNSPLRRSVSTSREKQSNGHISPVSPISLRTSEYGISRGGLVSSLAWDTGSNLLEGGVWWEKETFDLARRFYGTSIASPLHSLYDFPQNPFNLFYEIRN